MKVANHRSFPLHARAILSATCLLAVLAVPSIAGAASSPARVSRETLRVVALVPAVYGGRTAACPSRVLFQHALVRGCQDVIVTTEPGSKILLTLRYPTNRHYIVHREVYADARGMYQWVFPVDYTPSARERHASAAVVDVTVALGHAVKGSYAVFRVMPMQA